jgi:predicted DNA binding protein
MFPQGHRREELIRETRNGASSNTVHALATFIATYFPDVVSVCQMFDNVAKTFLGRRTGEKDWWVRHIKISDNIKETLKQLENHTLANSTEPIIPGNLTQPSDAQLTKLIPEVLRSEESRRIEDGL